MGAIFGLFFFIIILVLVIGLSIVSGILRFIFGIGRKAGFHSSSFGGEEPAQKAEPEPKHKKIFDKDDGEYVDYEEIKEDK
ncbi:DUF4834 family protein [uncultured Bacteroides sp.]|uniref:DUF4834 family protein n=1 Tax=uncultured Bacteroides sp. TaxID=162156 RepID=UPI002AAC4B0A|nr:DUF4834 family protein [uncultured Bacteroides sp.]